MTELKLPPKISLKKAPDSPAPVAAVAAPVAVAPQPVAEVAAPAPVAATMAAPAAAKPIIAAPKLTPRPMPVGVTAPTTAKPAGLPLPAMKPATTPPGSGIGGIKKPLPVGIKPVAAAKPIPVAAAKPMSVAAAVAAATPSSPTTAPTLDKRQTSRVELGVAAKTTSGSLDVSDLEATSSKDASKPDAKRMTAKISLDAVLTGPDPDADSGPKTIRLKRPGETTAPIKPSPIKPKADTSVVDASDDAAASKVTKSDAGESAEGDSGTKRTIRVKRAGGTGSQTSGPQSKTNVMDVQLEDLTQADSTHWAFVLCGVAAVIVAAVNLYITLAGYKGLPWIGSIS